MIAFTIKDLHSIVAPIRHGQLIVAQQTNTGGTSELAGIRAQATPRKDELALFGVFQDAMTSGIAHEDVILFVRAQITRGGVLPDVSAVLSDQSNQFHFPIEDFDPTFGLIDQIESVLRVHVHSVGKMELSFVQFTACSMDSLEDGVGRVSDQTIVKRVADI